MEKKQIRAVMRRLNRSLDAGTRRAASERIFEQVERSEAFRSARCVALYCALGDEPETRGAAERWLATGRRVAVPRVEGETMRFFDYDPARLVRGAFGIGEPAAEARCCPPEEIDLAVVPGVAFTPSGGRLGRGRGYYDRYLAQAAFRGVKIGVCYAHQLVGRLPAEAHDVAMDDVVTERGAVCGERR